MTKPKTNLLTAVTTKEVSLVDRGAVRRKFAFRKNDADPEGATMYEEILKACLETPIENEEAVDADLEKRGIDKRTGAAIKGAIRLLSSFKEDLSDSHKDALKGLMGGKKPAADAEDDKDGGDDEDTEDKPKKKTKSESGDTVDLGKAADAVQKLPPELQAQFAEVLKSSQAAQAEAVELRKELAARKDEEHLRVCIAKAQSQYSHLGPAKALGPVLQKLEKAGLLGDIENVLRGANERAKLGGTADLLKEQGTNKGWNDSESQTADSLLQKAAVEIAKAQGVPLITAHTMACSQNPELYDAYNREMALRAREGR